MLIDRDTNKTYFSNFQHSIYPTTSFPCTPLCGYAFKARISESVSAAKRGDTREISQKTEDTFHTVDGPRFAGGAG